MVDGRPTSQTTTQLLAWCDKHYDEAIFDLQEEIKELLFTRAESGRDTAAERWANDPTF